MVKVRYLSISSAILQLASYHVPTVVTVVIAVTVYLSSDLM